MLSVLLVGFFICYDFYYFFFFFFQAEDGIRDPLVTGVQTCALPISTSAHRAGSRCCRMNRRWVTRLSSSRSRFRTFRSNACRENGGRAPPAGAGERSEERRVGKEGRSGWAPDQQKKKERNTVRVTGM